VTPPDNPNPDSDDLPSKPAAQYTAAFTEEKERGQKFLREHLPMQDAALELGLIAENLTFAYKVRHATPCGMVVPEAVFHNDVLPHCFVDERRHPWRAMLHDRFVERAHRAASIEDAVMMLNQTVFAELDVAYHPTKRPHNNMSVAESIDCGYASCTGLSILLAAACRAVGIPARIAGVAAWADGSGNHTWIEVWDHGTWRVVAAAEGFAFDQTWFNDKARSEQIWAISYQPTGSTFPTPWEPSVNVEESPDAMFSELHAIDVSERYAALPPTPTNPTTIHVRPRSYVAPYITGPVQLSGKLDDPAWADVSWTEYFVDIEDAKKPTPRFHTRAKMMWDDEYFYIGAMLEDPHVWGSLTERNSIIFNDPDFEIFIDPDGDHHNYYEFEINALGTIWELTLERPYRDGGPVHRGDNMPGLRSAVHVHGVVNEPSGDDYGWSVEVAIPWSGLKRYCNDCDAANAAPDTMVACPPRPGDQWRINFSRVHWLTEIIDGAYRKVPREAHPEDNWVWSPQHAIDMHRPEHWGVVQFGGAELREDPDWPAKTFLAEVYQAQRDRSEPASTLEELGLRGLRDPTITDAWIDTEHPPWRAVAKIHGRHWQISHNSRLQRLTIRECRPKLTE